MDVVYIRYADDIILLCKTKRSLNRCRRRLMEVLAERKLTLSRKKSRMGDITKPFHLSWFIKTCWQGSIATYAKDLCQSVSTTSLRRTILADQTDGLAVAA
jgi:hypothetical protein